MKRNISQATGRDVGLKKAEELIVMGVVMVATVWICLKFGSILVTLATATASTL